MKFITTTTIMSLATLLSVAISTPTSSPQNRLTSRQDDDYDWSFSVYQSSQRCTGARDPYSGKGSQGCTRGIRNGSFGSFTRGDIKEGCSVYLYNNPDCNLDGIIEVLTSDTPEGCLQPAVEVTTSPSFDVVCN